MQPNTVAPRSIGGHRCHGPVATLGGSWSAFSQYVLQRWGRIVLRPTRQRFHRRIFFVPLTNEIAKSEANHQILTLRNRFHQSLVTVKG